MSIPWLCDVDPAQIDKMNALVTHDFQSAPPKHTARYEDVIEDKDVDAVIIATPHHWHAPIALRAMQAGKDVYVEKPVSHNVSEGRRVVEAARKYNRVCQSGTQSRSNPGMRQSIEYAHSGKIGEIMMTRGLCYKPRGSIGKVTADKPIPSTMDFDLWCGPAPMNPVHRNKIHYDWHWIWDYGNGDLGNQGIHEMDKARWALKAMELPKGVFSMGGRLGYEDDGQTPNTQICSFDYGEKALIFEVRGLPTKDFMGTKVGNIFYGTNGYIVCPSYATGIVFDKDNKEVTRFSGGGDNHHFENFCKAVRAKKPEMLNGDILEGHLSSALCHLGNISYRLGKDQMLSEKVAGLDEKTTEAVGRMAAHLADNKLDASKTKVTIGRKLVMDPKTETFINDAEANLMLTRPYRKGYEVPAKI